MHPVLWGLTDCRSPDVDGGRRREGGLFLPDPTRPDRMSRRFEGENTPQAPHCQQNKYPDEQKGGSGWIRTGLCSVPGVTTKKNPSNFPRNTLSVCTRNCGQRHLGGPKKKVLLEIPFNGIVLEIKLFERRVRNCRILFEVFVIFFSLQKKIPRVSFSFFYCTNRNLAEEACHKWGRTSIGRT